MSLSSINNIVSAQFTRNITELRQEMARTAEEATTGRYSDLTAHLSGRIGSAMLSQQALDNIALQREQLSYREGRLDVSQQSLTTIQNRIQGLEVSMRTALGMGNLHTQGIAARDAEAALGVAFSALNVRFGERYLFAGDATATQPLASINTLLSDIRGLANAAPDAAAFEAALDTYFNTPGGGWQTTIYGGTPAASDPEAATANDPALVEVIRGLAVMALADPQGQPALFAQPNGIVDTAAQRLSDGQLALTNLRSALGVHQERLSVQKQALDTEETIFTSAFNALTARDQYEAASALKLLESSLEASYALTSRLASLTLLNFLR